jgi:hypothetical protein
MWKLERSSDSKRYFMTGALQIAGAIAGLLLGCVVLVVLVSKLRAKSARRLERPPARILILILAKEPSKLLKEATAQLREELPANYNVWCVTHHAPGPSDAPWFLSVPDVECTRIGINGIGDGCHAGLCKKDKQKRPWAWDKGFYFAERMNYDFTWFLEDDVFIPTPAIFPRTDTTHPQADLLHSKCTTKKKGWRFSDLRYTDGSFAFPKPWLAAPCAAQVLRASRAMLRAVRQHLNADMSKSALRTNQTQYPHYLEYMWCNVAYHRGLVTETPEALAVPKGLLCRGQVRGTSAEERVAHTRDRAFLHPVDLAHHQDLRRVIKCLAAGPPALPSQR